MMLNWSTPPPEVIGTLTRYENAIILVCQCTALALFTNLLLFAQFYGGKLGKKIQPTMRLFLLFHSIGILTSLPASLHKVFMIFDPARSLSILFWIFALNGNYSLAIGPFFVLFITIERLIILRFPFVLPKYRKHFLLGVTLMALLLYMVSFSFFLAELPLNPNEALKCAPLVCIAPKFKFQPQTILKLSLGSCNLICSIIFFIMLNRELNKQIKNRVVKFTIICEIIFNIFPSIINFAITMLTGKNLSQFIGSFDLTMVNMDLAICSLFYTWIFLVVARHDMNLTTKVQPMSKVQRKGAEGPNIRLTMSTP